MLSWDYIVLSMPPRGTVSCWLCMERQGNVQALWKSFTQHISSSRRNTKRQHSSSTQQTLPEYISYANWRISGHQHENELVTKIQVCGSTIDSLQFLEHVFISAAQQLLGEGAWIHIVPLAGGPPR